MGLGWRDVEGDASGHRGSARMAGARSSYGDRRFLRRWLEQLAVAGIPDVDMGWSDVDPTASHDQSAAQLCGQRGKFRRDSGHHFDRLRCYLGMGWRHMGQLATSGYTPISSGRFPPRLRRDARDSLRWDSVELIADTRPL